MWVVWQKKCTRFMTLVKRFFCATWRTKPLGLVFFVTFRRILGILRGGEELISFFKQTYMLCMHVTRICLLIYGHRKSLGCILLFLSFDPVYVFFNISELFFKMKIWTDFWTFLPPVTWWFFSRYETTFDFKTRHGFLGGWQKTLLVPKGGSTCPKICRHGL